MVRVRKRASQIARETKRFQTAARMLGLRLRQLRQARELTLEAVAERADLDWKHLQKIEAGQVNVSLVSLVRVARGLDTSMEDLFVGIK
jgi:transcriptional regulator with XRE-family HTH domain